MLELAPADHAEHVFELFLTGTIGLGAIAWASYGVLGDAVGAGLGAG